MMREKPHPSIVVFARMEIALKRGRGIRLSNDDLHSLSLSFLGEVMAGAKEWATSTPSEAVEAPAVDQRVGPRN